MISRRTMIAGAAAFSTGCASTMPNPSIPKNTVKGYRGIARLPYFELGPEGLPVLTTAMRESLPAATDFHSHLGHSFMLAPQIDYHREHAKTDFLVACDDYDECEFNFNDYMNKMSSDRMIHDMDEKLVTSGLPGGSAAAETHTIPNLIREMDQLNIRRSVLLVVAPRLLFRYNQTQDWINQVASSGHRDRFVIFAGINVRDSGAVGQLRDFAKQGVRGVKIHPTVQHVSPDEEAAMRIYEVCEELGLHVFFHAGRAGVEPPYGRQFAMLHNYVAPIREFPNVQFIFGHSGARDWKDAVALARHYDNVWLELEGQGAYEIKSMINTIGHERILYGTDWPFYPLATTAARVFLATEGNEAARNTIMAHNANRLLGLPS